MVSASRIGLENSTGHFGPGIKIRCKNPRLFRRRVQTRFPFRFGKSQMTEMPVLYLRCDLEINGQARGEGVTASGIPPLWFDKRPDKTPQDNERDLLISVAEAAATYSLQAPETAWELHCAVTESVRTKLTAAGMAPLAAGFGPALLEAAVVDGVCRHVGLPFHAALRRGVLGLSAALAARLPESPTAFMRLRHTVGLADALSAADLHEPLLDGLPETLQEVVEVYAPGFFKIKISRDAEETFPRLRGIAEILDRSAGDYRVTLDGNEQFSDMGIFALFLERLRNDFDLRNFSARILWIEQPVTRDQALNPSGRADVLRVAAFKPVIIDESDGEADALERALELGYAGVSSKMCKGLFRSVSHFLKLREVEAQGRTGLILSSEDLTTVPLLPLQQDLSLAAALGLTHSERNGHHYIRGFEFLSQAEREDALRNYPSLYEPDPVSGAKVHVEQGGFRLGEVNAAQGFGASTIPDWEAMEPIALSAPSFTKDAP